MSKTETFTTALVFAGLLSATVTIFTLWDPTVVGEVRKGETQNGYWGPVASSVDWCEENYAWQSVPTVAEFHNTITAFLLAIGGWVVLFSASRVKAEWRFHNLGHTYVAVGLGAAAFHGTLLRGMQAADEVPMCWAAALGVWTCLEQHSPKGHPRYPKLPALMMVLLAFISYLNIFSEGPLAVFFFYASFAPLNGGFLVMSIQRSRSTNSPPVRQLYQRSLAQFALALLLWAADTCLCPLLQSLPLHLPNPQLHAYGWHLFVAIGSTGLITATMQDRMEFLHTQQQIQQQGDAEAADEVTIKKTKILYDPVLGLVPYLGVTASSELLMSQS